MRKHWTVTTQPMSKCWSMYSCMAWTMNIGSFSRTSLSLLEVDGGIQMDEWVCEKDSETKLSHPSIEAIRKEETDGSSGRRRAKGRIFMPKEANSQIRQGRVQIGDEVESFLANLPMQYKKDCCTAQIVGGGFDCPTVICEPSLNSDGRKRHEFLPLPSQKGARPWPIICISRDSLQ